MSIGKKFHIIIVFNHFLGRQTTNCNVSTHCSRAVKVLSQGSLTPLLFGEKSHNNYCGLVGEMHVEKITLTVMSKVLN